MLGSHTKINEIVSCYKEVIQQTYCVNMELGLNIRSPLLLCVTEAKSFTTKQLVSKLNYPIIHQEKLRIFSFRSTKLKTKTCVVQ